MYEKADEGLVGSRMCFFAYYTLHGTLTATKFSSAFSILTLSSHERQAALTHPLQG